MVRAAGSAIQDDMGGLHAALGHGSLRRLHSRERRLESRAGLHPPARFADRCLVAVRQHFGQWDILMQDEECMMPAEAFAFARSD